MHIKLLSMHPCRTMPLCFFTPLQMLSVDLHIQLYKLQLMIMTSKPNIQWCTISLSSLLLPFLAIAVVTDYPPASSFSLSSSSLAPLLTASSTVPQRCHLTILRALFPLSLSSLKLTMSLPPGLFHTCSFTLF